MSWAGRLLVATPLLTEDPFARAVVLLLQHGGDGALGVVLSRPSGIPVDDVLPGWQHLCDDPEVVFAGGPVQKDAALCLASCREGRLRASDGLVLQVVPGSPLAVVDLDADPEEVASCVSRVRVFAGYSGWTSGQLEAEVEEGAWWVLDALPQDPFSARPTTLWSDVLRRQQGVLRLAATLPEDPTQN